MGLTFVKVTVAIRDGIAVRSGVFDWALYSLILAPVLKSCRSPHST
jgi:hypothetical protein